MATKKNYRANNTRLIECGENANPKLMAQALSDGTESLYLEYYMGFEVVESKNGNKYKKINRKTERLKLSLWQSPRTTIERTHNKETLNLAKQIRHEREQQLLEQGEGYRLKKEKDINFLDWMWDYYEKYTKGDKRHIKRSCTIFQKFLNEIPEYKKYSERIKPEQINKEMIILFTEYLQSEFKGLGPHTLFARFKKMMKAAYDKDLFRRNPCDGVTIKEGDDTVKKDILSLEEIQTLIDCHYQGENETIRRAFIFSLCCGVRYCDVKEITFRNVDRANRRLKFTQVKTGKTATIPLNDALFKLIGEPSDNDNLDENIFKVPSHTMCLKALRHWTKRAGISKHITWHCARHSFAVNILSNGADIKTVSGLLGHASLQHTNRYLREVERLKEDAINSLSVLSI